MFVSATPLIAKAMAEKNCAIIKRVKLELIIKNTIENTFIILAKIRLFLFPIFSIKIVNGIKNMNLKIG